MALARTTELEAVNTMLSAVGEPPINFLDGQKNADAAIARNILTEISRDVQMQGWHFNTQINVTLTPGSDTFITLSDNVVRADIEYWTSGGSSDNRDITQRGNRLFNKTDNTYAFTKDVKATVVYLLDWERLLVSSKTVWSAHRHTTLSLRKTRSVQGLLLRSSRPTPLTRQSSTTMTSLISWTDRQSSGDHDAADQHQFS